MAQHAQPRIDTGRAIYFRDPHSPWQRGMRQYFPRGSDLTKHSVGDLAGVAAALSADAEPVVASQPTPSLAQQ